MVLSCAHSSSTTDVPLTNILNAKELICSDCDCQGPNLWICLYKNCYRIGCAEKSNDHSTLHNAAYPTHCVHMNLSTRRIWCYQCKKEVFMDATLDSDREESATLRSHDSGRGSYATLRTETPSSSIFERAINVGMHGDASDSSDNDDYADYNNEKPCGLVGLQNIGNTCYMNAALQALSNTEPLTKFFLECWFMVQLLSEGKKPGLSRTYLALMRDIWIKKTNHGYVIPSGILYGIRSVHAMFRGYQQHDTQEFLRNFMDQLHEELKQAAPPEPPSSGTDADTFSLAMEEPTMSSSYDSSEGEYETCDSGVSERSSLSDDNDRPTTTAGHCGNGAKRRLSRCGSPNRRQRQRMQSYNVIDSQPSTCNLQGNTCSTSTSTTKKQTKYRSIISDIFDGKLLSSVQCLTCDRISSRIETFQDLSLPIPSRDHLVVLHGRSATPGATCSDALIPVQDGWMAWLLAWLKSWFYGPTVTLHDCLAAFFSTDELKGDNMYSCEKCNKLRNGIKFSKVLQLPEILCIHLKRFRHELMFSSKISSAVSFPLKGLDMKPYLHNDCTSKVSSYDLFSVICHHGTAGGGHYTCFALNNGQWYEFDDQYVTKVNADKVQACEAYVLFYRKSGALADVVRSKAEKIRENSMESLKRTYISKQWINKFNYCAEPGPIDNSDFLCPHGAFSPDRYINRDKLTIIIPYEVYDFLHKKFGGCLPLIDINLCVVCSALQKRLLLEMETFVQVNRESNLAPHTHYLSATWYTQWHNFVQKRNQEPPGPIDNSKIDPARPDLNEALEVSESIWNFFYNVYGGGPEIRINNTQHNAKVMEVENDQQQADDDLQEFVIPTLKKKVVHSNVNKSMYGQGEPVEVENGEKEENENAVIEDEMATPASPSMNGTVDDDIDEEEGEEIRNSRRYRKRRKNLIAT